MKMFNDIYLRNNYRLYLDNNISISKRYFYNADKVELFSTLRGYQYRTFYKKLNSNLILVSNKNKSGYNSYYYMEYK